MGDFYDQHLSGSSHSGNKVAQENQAGDCES